MADETSDWFSQNAPPAQDWFSQNAPPQTEQQPSGVGQVLKTAGKAALETVKGFLPTSLHQVEEMATPVLGSVETLAATPRKLYDVAFGGKSVAEAFPETQTLVQAEKTPAFSKERFEAGFGILGQLGTAAAIGHGLPGLKETAFGKPPPETLSEEVVSAQQSQPVEEVKPSATQERQVQESVQPERTGDGEGRASTEAGSSGGVRTEAQVQPQEVAPISQPEPVSEGGEASTVSTLPEQQIKGGETVEKVQGKEDEGQGGKGRVLAEPTAAAEPSTAAAAPAGVTSVEAMTKPLSETGGPSISAMAERPIKLPEAGTPVGWSESTAHGHDWLDKGGNIEDVLNTFRTTGKVDPWDIGKGSAYLERLQAKTNAAGDALDKKPNDPMLQNMFNESLKNEQAFSDTFKPMATTASNSLKGFQGKRPLTPEMALSNTGLTRKFIENLRRDPTPEEATKVRQLSEKNKNVSEQYVKNTEELYKEADKAHGTTKGVKTPVTAQDLVKMFQEPLMEVCDI